MAAAEAAAAAGGGGKPSVKHHGAFTMWYRLSSSSRLMVLTSLPCTQRRVGVDMLANRCESEGSPRPWLLVCLR